MAKPDRGRGAGRQGGARAAIAPLRAALATNPFDPRVHCALAAAYADAAAAEPPAAAVIAREQQFCREPVRRRVSQVRMRKLTAPVAP